MADEDERALIERVLGGDREAFGALVDSYGRLVYNLALRMVRDREDARDLAQTVFLKAYERLGTFDRRNRFFSWIYRITVNESLNWIGRRRPQEALSDEASDGGETPDEAAETAEAQRLVQRALVEMRDDDRDVIVMRHFLQLSHREMGEALHLPEKTVKSRLHTARGRLAEALKRYGYEAT